MKEEWAQLQQNPSSIDDQITKQLGMLEDIDSSAFRNILGEADAYAGEEEEDPRTNPAQMGRIMKEVEKGS